MRRRGPAERGELPRFPPAHAALRAGSAAAQRQDVVSWSCQCRAGSAEASPRRSSVCQAAAGAGTDARARQRIGLPPHRNSSSGRGADLTGPGCPGQHPALCRHSSPPVLSHHTPHTCGNRENPLLPPPNPPARPTETPSPALPSAAPSHAPRHAHPPSFLLISSFAQQFGDAESIKWLQSDQWFQGQGVKEESGDRTEVHFPVKVLQ